MVKESAMLSFYIGMAGWWAGTNGSSKSPPLEGALLFFDQSNGLFPWLRDQSDLQ